MKNYVTLVHPRDCIPPHSLDMSSRHDYEKVEYLEDCFREKGFDNSYPALVGYPNEGRVQLLSGTHRHYAALKTDTLLPVTLWLRSYIEKSWGTDYWFKVIKDIPVRDLLNIKSPEGDLLKLLADPVNFEYLNGTYQ